MNNAIWLSGEPVSVVDLPYWPNNSCFFSGVKYIIIKILWHAPLSLPDGYAPGSTPRQIILTLDPAGAWRKDTLFFANDKPFFIEKEDISIIFSSLALNNSEEPPLYNNTIEQTKTHNHTFKRCFIFFLKKK